MAMLRKELAPKELKLPPAHLFEMPGMGEFLEWSLYQGWMRQWLQYLSWYCRVAMRPDVTLEELLDAPVVTVHWNSTNRDESLIRIGFQWKAYDLVASELVRRTVTSLPYKEASDLDDSSFYLFGGYSGSQFLVRAWGLTQPRAQHGVISFGMPMHTTIGHKWRTYFDKGMGLTTPSPSSSTASVASRWQLLRRSLRRTTRRLWLVVLKPTDESAIYFFLRKPRFETRRKNLDIAWWL